MARYAKQNVFCTISLVLCFPGPVFSVCPPRACRVSARVCGVGSRRLARAPPRRPPFYYMWTHVPMSMFFFRAVGRGRFCWRRCAGISFVLARSAPSDTATHSTVYIRLAPSDTFHSASLYPTRSLHPTRSIYFDSHTHSIRLAPSDTLHSDSHTPPSDSHSLPTRNGMQRSITATYAQHLHLAWRWLLATSIC